MSKFITDDAMRSLWRARCQAREGLAALGLRKRPIHDFTHDERKALRRCEYAVYWATRDLERGLRQRPDHQFRVGDTVLILDGHGSLVPVWGWMWTHDDPSWQDHAVALMERREAVAC